MALVGGGGVGTGGQLPTK